MSMGVLSIFLLYLKVFTVGGKGSTEHIQLAKGELSFALRLAA